MPRWAPPVPASCSRPLHQQVLLCPPGSPLGDGCGWWLLDPQPRCRGAWSRALGSAGLLLRRALRSLLGGCADLYTCKERRAALLGREKGIRGEPSPPGFPSLGLDRVGVCRYRLHRWRGGSTARARQALPSPSGVTRRQSVSSLCPTHRAHSQGFVRLGGEGKAGEGRGRGGRALYWGRRVPGEALFAEDRSVRQEPAGRAQAFVGRARIPSFVMLHLEASAALTERNLDVGNMSVIFF